MSIPLGFLLDLVLSRKAWWVEHFLLPAFSGAIEYTQGPALEARGSTTSLRCWQPSWERAISRTKKIPINQEQYVVIERLGRVPPNVNYMRMDGKYR